MTELVRNFKPLYNENLFSIKSLFADNPFVTCDSPRAYNFTFNNSKVAKAQAFFIEGYFAPADTNYNFAFLDALDYTAVKTGLYVFQFNLFIENFVDLNESSSKIIVNIFKNGILTAYERNITDLINIDLITNQIELNIWQSFSVNAGDLIQIGFRLEKITASSGVPVIVGDHYFSAFKLELVRGGEDASPTPYNYPINYLAETSKVLSNEVHGWAYYVDSLTIPSITINTSYTQITIDGLGASVTTYLPKEIRDILQLFADNKITPIAIGDDYDGRFDTTVISRTGAPTQIEFIIDISGGVAGTNKVFTGYIDTLSSTPYDQSLPIDFFTLATFLANGGALYARTDSGSVTIGRRNIKISRKSKFIE